jgi:hypothetical protein
MNIQIILERKATCRLHIKLPQGYYENQVGRQGQRSPLCFWSEVRSEPEFLKILKCDLAESASTGF